MFKNRICHRKRMLISESRYNLPLVSRKMYMVDIFLFHLIFPDSSKTTCEKKRKPTSSRSRQCCNMSIDLQKFASIQLLPPALLSRASHRTISITGFNFYNPALSLKMWPIFCYFSFTWISKGTLDWTAERDRCNCEERSMPCIQHADVILICCHKCLCLICSLVYWGL